MQYSADPTVLHISNDREIPADTRAEVSFVCDFSRVPVGYTVYNSVGGNTTETKKVGGSLVLHAAKTVDGLAPDDARFSFCLADTDGKILQTVQNSADGAVDFDALQFTPSDLGKTFVYTIYEQIPADDARFIYDESVYTVTVRVADSASSDGNIPAQAVYTKDGLPVDSVVFGNRCPEPEPKPEPEPDPEPEPEPEPKPEPEIKPLPPAPTVQQAESKSPKTGAPVFPLMLAPLGGAFAAALLFTRRKKR